MQFLIALALLLIAGSADAQAPQGANPLASKIAQQRDLFANALASAQIELDQKDAEIADLKKKCGKPCKPPKPAGPSHPGGPK